MSNVINEIQAEANRIEWNAIYSSKGHFNAAMLWNATHYSLGMSAVLCGAFAGKEFVEVNPTMATVLASSAAAISAIITFLKPSDKATPHHQSGVKIAAIISQARIFQNITSVSVSDTKLLTQELKELSTQYSQLNKNVPAIPFLAYQITRWGVRRGEHTYKEEDER